MTIEVAFLVVGVVLGLAIGRGSALLAAPAVGVGIALSATELEVSSWLLGLISAAIIGLGIAARVALRSVLRARITRANRSD